MGNALSIVRRPRFCPFGNEATRSEEIEFQALLETQWQNWSLPQLPVTRILTFDDVMTRIFHRLRQLSLIPFKSRPKVGSLCQLIYASHALVLESHINGSYWATILNKERDGSLITNTTNQIFHITGFIYVYLALRETPIEAIIYNNVVSRLKTNLESLDQSRSFGGLEADFFLWVLMVGGAASFQRPERSWFVILLTQLRQVLQLRTLEDAKSLLKEYPWVENSFETLSREFWEESDRLGATVDM
jgi:hypothetical protein